MPVLGDEEWPDVHGVGRRDAPITDVDREALRWIKNQRTRALARGAMGTDQREAFDRLLESFVLRLKPEQVGREMDRIRAAGQDDLHFVWAGSHRIDEPHYFRIEGPVTLIEFDNTEDNANHVHCVWRDPDERLRVRHPRPAPRGPARPATDSSTRWVIAP